MICGPAYRLHHNDPFVKSHHLTPLQGHDSVPRMEQEQGFKEVVLRLIAIVGLIAVLVLGAWGIILLAFNVAGLFNGSVNFSSLFSNNLTEQPATTTVPVVVTNTNNNGNTNGNGTQQPNNTNTNVGTQQPNAVYTAAPRVKELYGLPDLAVTVTSVTSLSSVQGRTVVQFVISNVGTNVAYSGWAFTASLPLINQNPYLYQSIAQQALYPGDKIAYTLTYDDQYFRNNNYGQPCTLQYPNYNCQNNYQYNQYQYNYTTPSTCYTYNGYQNVPGPCVTYDENGNAVYNQYNQYQNPNYNTQAYNYNQNYYQYNRTVTVTVDPQNRVPEVSDYNNTASKNLY